jgi:16S rRNA processing protein RimM
VVPLPGQDLLAVDHSGREILVPFVRAIVPTVDVKNKIITVIEQEGLLDVE